MPAVHFSHKEDRYWVRDGDDIAWFDGPLEAKDAALMLERKHTAQTERARIVAWLRRIGKPQLADAIEREEHLK